MAQKHRAHLRPMVWLVVAAFLNCLISSQASAQGPINPPEIGSHRVSVVAISPDGKTVASGTNFGEVRIWDATTGQERALLGKIVPSDQHYPVDLLAFSSDGKTLLSGKGDQSLKLWEVETGKEITKAPLTRALIRALAEPGPKLDGDPPLPIPPGALAGLGPKPNEDPVVLFSRSTPPAISADFKTLAMVTPKGIELWNIEQGTQVGILQSAKKSTRGQIAFDQTGGLLGVVHDTGVDVWDIKEKKTLCTYQHGGMRDDSITSMAFSPDGALAASGDANSSVEILESGGGSIHTEKPLRNLIRLWNPRTGKEIGVLEGHMGPINALRFSLDGKTLISASDDQTIRFWDVAGKREKSVLAEHNAPVRCLALSQDGKALASGSNDQTVKLWDVAGVKETRTLLWTVAADQDVTLSAYSAGPALSPDGKTVFYGTTTGMIRAVEGATGKVTASLAGHADIVVSISLSRDGKTLASGGFDFLVRIWDVPSGKCIGVVRAPEEGLMSRGQEMHCLLSPDGRSLATVAFGGERLFHTEVTLWDVPSLKLRTVQRSSSKMSVTSMAFSPDSKTLAWRGGYVRLLTLETLREEPELKDAGDSFTFSPDGKTLAVQHKMKVDLWNIATQKRFASWVAHKAPICGLDFHPKQPLLAITAQDGTVKLWELTNRTEVSSLVLPEKLQSGPVFSPDGTRLAITVLGGTLKMLQLGKSNKLEDPSAR